MIRCGWCGHATEDGPCVSCGRPAALPWVQRAQTPPVIPAPGSGRPVLAEDETRRRYEDAVAALRAEHRVVTLEALAERLDRSPRQVREWRRRFGL